MRDLDIFAGTKGVALVAPAAGLNTTGAIGASVDLQANGLGEGVALVELTGLNTAGTTPTCVVKLQSSPDNATWVDVPGAVFTGLTTTNVNGQQELKLDMAACGRYVQAYATFGGTTPAYTLAARILARPKYM
jgi:hypothetical protein